MAEKTKLRWFQISLRSLLLLTLLVGGSLGWKLQRVRLRKTLIDNVHERGGGVGYPSSGAFSDDSVPRDGVDLFGDASVKSFYLPTESFDESDVKRLRQAFPEATVESTGPFKPAVSAPD